jgi:hypothetical protein
MTAAAVVLVHRARVRRVHGWGGRATYHFLFPRVRS